MTQLRERIREDGVGMRWLRTAATTIIALSGALGIVWGAMVYLLAPRLDQYATGLVVTATADLADEQKQIGSQVDRLEGVVTEVVVTVNELARGRREAQAPAWRFHALETSIEDGFVGSVTIIKAAGFKLRECGVPVVDLYFVDAAGVYHRFETPSLLSVSNRGIALPVDPDRMQRLSYTAHIPASPDITPGRAQGFISLTYSDKCPQAETAVVGPLQFRIFEAPLTEGGAK